MPIAVFRDLALSVCVTPLDYYKLCKGVTVKESCYYYGDGEVHNSCQISTVSQ